MPPDQLRREAKLAKTFKRAFSGVLEVERSAYRATVSKRRIIAMASVIVLLDPERSGAEPEGQGESE